MPTKITTKRCNSILCQRFRPNGRKNFSLNCGASHACPHGAHLSAHLLEADWKPLSQWVRRSPFVHCDTATLAAGRRFILLTLYHSPQFSLTR